MRIGTLKLPVVMKLWWQVDVSIHIINGKTSTVTFVGVGYDHCSGRSDGEDSAGRLTTSAIPEKQLVPVEGQVSRS